MRSAAEAFSSAIRGRLPRLVRPDLRLVERAPARDLLALGLLLAHDAGERDLLLLGDARRLDRLARGDVGFLDRPVAGDFQPAHPLLLRDAGRSRSLRAR